MAAPGSALLDTRLQAVERLRDPSHVRDDGARERASTIEAAGPELRHLSLHRLSMDVPVRITQMRTPEAAAAAIWYVQDRLPAGGAATSTSSRTAASTLDTIRIEAVKGAALRNVRDPPL